MKNRWDLLQYLGGAILLIGAPALDQRLFKTSELAALQHAYDLMAVVLVSLLVQQGGLIRELKVAVSELAKLKG